MDDAEDDVRSDTNLAGGEHQDREGYDRENGGGAAVDGSYTQLNNEYGGEEDEDDEETPEELVEDEDDDDDEDGDGVQRIGNDVVNDGHEEDGDDGVEEGYKRKIEDVDFERHPKKRRLKNLVSNYEFAPRIAQAEAQAQPSAVTLLALPPPAHKQSFGGRNGLADWTERETFVLLDAWGDRFLQHGRKSLRSEEWQEVAKKVSQESEIERTDTQCRNRVDTLKKKFKKEKAKFGAAGSQLSKWIYFKKMDVLMSPPVKQAGLSRGIDSGEYVSSNPRVYLNRANGFNEMRDSSGHSDSTEEDTNDSDGLPPKKKKTVEINNSNTRIKNECSAINLLADSLNNFSKIYEKIESNKRQQMAELERMRMDFQRDLEEEKKVILERAKAEIAKIWQGDDGDNGANISS